MSSSATHSILDPPLTPFDELLNKIRPILIKGNVQEHKKEILTRLANYDSRSEDWCHYAHFSESQYTRNLVEDGADNYNIMTMCWKPGQASSIHGHEGANCFIKVLCGQLTEERHNYPTGAETGGDTKEGFHRQVLESNNVHYIDDTMGVHKMINSGQRDAVSLHVYSPPYRNCRIFSLVTPNAHPNSDYALSNDHHRHHQQAAAGSLVPPDYNGKAPVSKLANPINSKVVQVEFYSETIDSSG